MIYGSKHYRREMRGLQVPHDAYVNVCGTDLVRREDGAFVVLEDNLRVPSGVSYMLANRDVVRRAFPGRIRVRWAYARSNTTRRSCCATLKIAGALSRRRFDRGADAGRLQLRLLRARLSRPPDGRGAGRGPRPARQRQCCLHAHDQRAEADRRHLSPDRRRLRRSPDVPRRLRRWALPGLFNAYRAGNVVIANALGPASPTTRRSTAYVPRLIRYYLSEDPILDNVETFLCREAASLSHVLANLDKLVVKAVGESGGYGMLVGPHASRASARPSPRRSRPIRETTSPSPPSLSTAPTLVDGRVEPRHVDLRPFILHRRGDEHRSRCADPRGADQGQSGGQFAPGRRLERHLGAERDALSCRRQSVLDGPLYRARRAHEPTAGGAPGIHGRARSPKEDADRAWGTSGAASIVGGRRFLPRNRMMPSRLLPRCPSRVRIVFAG